LAKRLSAQTVRRRILRTFLMRRRWLGFFLLRHDGEFSGVDMSAFCGAVVRLIAEGRLLSIYDAHPAREFWVYLSTELLPSPEDLADRIGPACAKGGLLPCHVRSQN
jgi:hypothetical protein